jgi:hypothetical protein
MIQLYWPGRLRWKRSRQGNLWTRVDGETLVLIYGQYAGDGYTDYGWCIGRGDEEQTWSKAKYSSEAEAQRAAVKELEARELL